MPERRGKRSQGLDRARELRRAALSDRFPQDLALLLAIHPRGHGGINGEHDGECPRGDDGEAAQHPDRLRPRSGPPPHRDQALNEEDRKEVDRGELRREREPERGRRDREAGRRRLFERTVPGEDRCEEPEGGADVGVDDAGVREEVRIQGHERRREEGRAGAVARPRPQEDQGEEGREHPAERGARRRRDGVGRYSVLEQEGVAEVGEVVAERHPVR
jgi:hypothetical protein